MAIEEILALRHKLHKNAELSGCETKTKEILKEFLRKHTDLEIIDRGNWFYAKKEGKGGHKIAFRADFDAVAAPDGGAKHMCGHDGHSSILAGTALALSKEELRDTVYFIFQHGEENGTGGKECSQLISEEGIEEVYGLHNIPGFPKNAVLVRNNTFACASVGMTIHFEGKPSHAAYPEAGRNPGAATGAVLTMAEQVLLEEGYTGMVLCTPICVELGEPAFGVSASDSRLMFTIRAHYEQDLNRLRDRLEAYSREQASKYGLSVSFSYQEGFPDTVNFDACVERVRLAAKAAGLSIVEVEEPFRWSEDFGYYLKETKGAFFGIGDGEAYPQLHTESYEFPDDIISTGIDMFSNILKVQK